MNNNLNAALQYAQIGFSVIPVSKNKKPLTNWKEWQSKKANEQRIKSWFAKFPQANVGIVTGKISEIVVIDVEAGGTINDLPKTVTSKTGGGGWHLFYKYNPQRPVNNSGRIRELTDIRGDGGYVVVPPSMHESGNLYVWEGILDKESLSEFPYWILDKPSVQHSQSSLSSESAKIPEGSRNVTATKVAGKIIHDLDSKHLASLGWPSFQQWNLETCIPSLEKSELRAIWDSIIKKDQNKAKSNTKIGNDKDVRIETYAKRFRDGLILEAYFDSKKEETGLLVFQGGQVSKVNEITVNDKTYTAPPASNRLIAPGFIKLPSDAIEFGTEFSLLMEIKAFIHKYVQISEEFEDIASYYVLFSWVYDEFRELPYLRAIGDYGSGKSRFLTVMLVLCYRAVSLNGAASTSAIFRIINDLKGTLILDEADFQNSDTSNEIVKILNSGFQKGTPVFRSEAKGDKNQSFDPVAFDVFCPKVLATRKNFRDDALESRCLNHSMESLTREDIPENLDDNFEVDGLNLRNKLVMFRFKKLEAGIKKNSLPKLNIEPRLKQIISPIYRVITDENAQQLIINFVNKKQEELLDGRFESFEGELLQAFLLVYERDRKPTMKAIAAKYNDEFGGKYPVKAKSVGKVFEQIFHLQKQKSSQGIYICDNEENGRRIIALKVKFGIEKQEMNIVNLVNIDSGESLYEKAVEFFSFE